MIDEVIKGSSFDPTEIDVPQGHATMTLARAITIAELRSSDDAGARPGKVPVIGLTGTGGSGKSSLTDELVHRFVRDFPDKRVAVLCVDPTRRKTGGALLGDRIRFNSLKNPRVFLRSLATRGAHGEVATSLDRVLSVVERAGFDLILLETAGIGQGDSGITEFADTSVYVMTSEYGAPSQLEKIDMLDYADFVVVNKFTRRGSEDALRDVRKQVQRNRQQFDADPASLMVFGTSAAHFNDPGVNALYAHLVAHLGRAPAGDWRTTTTPDDARTTDQKSHVIPPGRERYLSEIADACRDYRDRAREQAECVRDIEALRRAIALMGGPTADGWNSYGDHPDLDDRSRPLAVEHDARRTQLAPRSLELLEGWTHWEQHYDGETFSYQVRGKNIAVDNYRETLSTTKIRKVARPRYRSAADLLYWRLLENVPGEFPYTSGTFPFKREAEDPTRMFAGEGPAGRTNERFHYLADGQPAKRLSTAFDSITLYGEDPARRPDIYGKIGESGSRSSRSRRPSSSTPVSTYCASDDLGVDDHQRTGTDHSGFLLSTPPSVSNAAGFLVAKRARSGDQTRTPSLQPDRHARRALGRCPVTHARRRVRHGADRRR